LGCDLFACSPYKFFGPHAGALFVRAEVLETLTPLKVRPSSNDLPWRFAAGTPSFEAQSGTTGAVEHIAWLGEAFGGADPQAPLRERLGRGWTAAAAHEQAMARRFLSGLKSLPGATLYGLSGDNEMSERVATFSFTLPGVSAPDAVRALAERNIFGWAGSFYAHEASHVLGVHPHGVIRLGMAHYTAPAEVDRALEALEQLAA